MVTMLTRRSFKLFEIEERAKQNFEEVKWHDLSDFHAEALRWIGNAMRQDESQHFWNNGAYCWYTDDTQSHEECVWMTTNGIAMFEDITENKLYRILFK